MPQIKINGVSRNVDADPQMPLLWAIRDILGLTGTKFGCGIGAALLERTFAAARSRGIKSLHLTYLAENLRMRHLARKFNADVKLVFGTVTGKLEVPARLLRAA